MTPLYEVECPVCHEPAGKRCRTLKTKRVTDTHIARIDEAYLARIKEYPDDDE